MSTKDRRKAFANRVAKTMDAKGMQLGNQSFVNEVKSITGNTIPEQDVVKEEEEDDKSSQNREEPSKTEAK